MQRCHGVDSGSKFAWVAKLNSTVPAIWNFEIQVVVRRCQYVASAALMLVRNFSRRKSLGLRSSRVETRRRRNACMLAPRNRARKRLATPLLLLTMLQVAAKCCTTTNPGEDVFWKASRRSDACGRLSSLACKEQVGQRAASRVRSLPTAIRLDSFVLSRVWAYTRQMLTKLFPKAYDSCQS